MTFVQVKDAVAIYPLFAFLALRFAIASGTLRRARRAPAPALGRDGALAGILAGALLGGGYALQTAGLERTTVSSTGFITGHVRRADAAARARALPRADRPRRTWLGVAARDRGARAARRRPPRLALGDLLVLAGAAVYSLQIVLMERYAPRYDALAFTLVEMLAAFGGLLAIALARGDLRVPHGWTVWGALLVTGVFASALAFLAQTWAQRRTTRRRRRSRSRSSRCGPRSSASRSPATGSARGWSAAP